MKIQTKMIMLAIVVIAGCTAPAPEEKKESGQVKLSIIDDATRNDVINSLKAKYGASLAFRIEKGVVQAAEIKGLKLLDLRKMADWVAIVMEKK